jgi:hypothetical protein
MTFESPSERLSDQKLHLNNHRKPSLCVKTSEERIELAKMDCYKIFR